MPELKTMGAAEVTTANNGRNARPSTAGAKRCIRPAKDETVNVRPERYTQLSHLCLGLKLKPTTELRPGAPRHAAVVVNPRGSRVERTGVNRPQNAEHSDGERQSTVMFLVAFGYLLSAAMLAASVVATVACGLRWSADLVSIVGMFGTTCTVLIAAMTMHAACTIAGALARGGRLV